MFVCLVFDYYHNYYYHHATCNVNDDNNNDVYVAWLFDLCLL